MRWPKLVQGFTQSMPMAVTVDADGIDEDGAPVVGAAWEGKANYQDHVVEVFQNGKAETEVKATIYIDGDPFPTIGIISGGTVEVLGDQRSIIQGMKARNPDGTVNYTRIDLR